VTLIIAGVADSLPKTAMLLHSDDTLSKLLFLSKQCSIHHKQTLIINEIEAASECSNMAVFGSESATPAIINVTYTRIMLPINA
jgi:hypothetical protein